MSKPDGGPAFPFATHTQDQRGVPIAHIRDGMTLRDYFAAAALPQVQFAGPSQMAKEAYHIADAMLAERNK